METVSVSVMVIELVFEWIVANMTCWTLLSLVIVQDISATDI